MSRGEQTARGFVDFAGDAGRLVEDEQKSFGVVALEAVRLVCGKAEGEPVVIERDARLGDLAAEGNRGGADLLAYLGPEDGANLAMGRRGGEDDRVRVRVKEPDGGAGGDPGLADAVAAAHGHAAAVAEGVEHVGLSAPGLRPAEDAPAEEERVLAGAREDGPGDAVPQGDVGGARQLSSPSSSASANAASS